MNVRKILDATPDHVAKPRWRHQLATVKEPEKSNLRRSKEWERFKGAQVTTSENYPMRPGASLRRHLDPLRGRSGRPAPRDRVIAMACGRRYVFQRVLPVNPIQWAPSVPQK